MAEAAGIRDGFTIVEVLLALVLLSFVVLGFQAATGEIIRHAGESDHRTVAAQLVEDRLDRVRLDPEYEAIQARYEGVETSLPGHGGLIRTTKVVRTRQEREHGVLDYQTITVTVDGPALRGPVARTVVVGAP